MQVPNGLFAAFYSAEMPIPTGTIGGREMPADIEISQHIQTVLSDAGTIGLGLNRKSFPATQPYAATVGDWLMIDYFNEGMQVHPMHQHQFPELVRDGFPLDKPYWVDTLTVAPGERYTVILQTDEPGAWVWHSHILNHVEREEGIFGMVTAS
jgi:FtsP/CotA-like multicopper oxidase with cupredoxin domain